MRCDPFGMWTIDGEPEYFADGQGIGGYDGDCWKWWLCRGEDRTFIFVQASSHVLLDADVRFEETRVAASSRGRSEVERYLADDIPPRVIELISNSRPRITRRDAAINSQR